jgi:uncharacterized membrane protein HdeD (DUF308 family)
LMIISRNIRAKNKSKILGVINVLKNWKVQEIGGAVALLICGLVLLLMPELTLVTIANVIGILVIMIGAFFLIGYFLRKELAAGNNDLIKGLVIVCIGIFICVKSELVVSVLPVVLGIGVVLSGILKLQHAFDLKRMGFDTWVRIGLTAVVNIFIGLIVILNPFSTVAWLMRLVGIGFLFSGVTDLITTIYVSKKASEYYVDGKAEETDEEIK